MTITRLPEVGHVAPLLSIENLTVSYGAVIALHGIDIEVHEGEIVALIGSNGAGKTTTLAAIAGLVKTDDGSVRLRGDDITAVRADRLVARGLSMVQEGRQVVPHLTVTENLLVGAYLRTDDGVKIDVDGIFEIFPGLKERRFQNAGSLSGGEQQMLAVGRALMARPKILLLDEPSMGLAPLVISRIFDVIRDSNRTGVTVVLVEQNATQALRIAHRAYVLEKGRIRFSGPADEVRRNPAVVKSYLGGQNRRPGT